MIPKQALRFDQRLSMTFALGQALRVLEMPQLELGAWLYEEIEKNPLFEIDSSSRLPLQFKIEPEASLPAVPTLHEHLSMQIREAFPYHKDLALAFLFLEQLDEKGFITAPLETFTGKFPLSKVESVLSKLQTLDPPGIFARSLQESLLLQLESQQKTNSSAFFLTKECFDDLLHGRYAVIKKKLPLSDLSSAIQTLSKLSFRPSSAFQNDPSSPVFTDLYIAKVDGKWAVDVNEDDLPQFHLREEYLLLEPTSSQEKEALQSFITSAKWLLRSLSKRQKTLIQIGSLLAKKQSAYLEKKGPLALLTIKEISEELQIHESTLSRALADKHASTPRGLIPLRSLISASPETASAKQLIEQLALKEDPQNPLTDDELAEKLKQSGFTVARRTVAKYRGQLKIGSAAQRKHSKLSKRSTQRR